MEVVRARVRVRVRRGSCIVATGGGVSQWMVGGGWKDNGGIFERKRMAK